MNNQLRHLARFIVDLKITNVPVPVQEAASLCILDSVAAAMGACKNDQIQRVLKQSLAYAGQNGAVEIWGQACKAPLLTAVFLNSMMGHTLELDDVQTVSKTHIGTVVVPAAWSLAQLLQADGAKLTEAVLCGYETMSRIGMSFGVSAHRNKGWHVTATAGTFGAAAACAKLLGLDEQHTVWALGLAGAQSFGTWAFLGDGASCKVLNPARAAASGCEAALLAQAGMSGPEHILTAEDGGLLWAMSDSADASLVDRDLGEVWQICTMDNKPYPCCRSTHCAIDGALALRRRYNLSADQVDRVLVETYSVGNKQCGTTDSSRHPTIAVEAKFSTPYTVAAALLDGELSLRQFLPDQITRPAVQELLKHVQVETADRFTSVYPKHWGCHITIFCTDGRVLEEEVPDASGSVDNPLTAEQVVAKATGLLREARPDTAGGLAQDILAVRSAAALPSLL